MGKRKTSSRRSRKVAEKPEVSEELSTINGDLRTAPPVVRTIAFVKRLHAEANKVCVKLASWAEQNPVVSEASSSANELANSFPALEDALVELKDSGFSPPRTTYTASTDEGDTVMVLDKFREKYEDLMNPASMTILTVIKKHPGKGGGLIVESSDKVRMKVATSHVVKL
jgi:hypothetical protein